MYEPNSNILLDQIQVAFRINETLIEARAQFLLRLLPKPSFVIELYDLPADIPIEHWENIELHLENGTAIEVFCISHNYHSTDSITTSNCVLIPREGRCTLLKRDSPMHSVDFRILNFPQFYGKQDTVFESKDVDGIKTQRLGTVLLESSVYRISISALPELQENEKKLNSDGGYAITHTGHLTRSDGQSFLVEEVESLITHTLRLFLSFARGAFCAIVDIVGMNHEGEEVWNLCGNPIVAPWSVGGQSWFDTNHGQILVEVFAGFCACLNDTQKGDKIERGLHWYLAGNKGIGFVDADTVLVQAALEYFSHVQSDRVERGRTASESIRIALDELGICVDIPESCQKLKCFAKEHELEHGPHALTELRNDMIHAHQRYGEVPSEVYFEAKNLGLWYVEMILLKHTGHDGLYGNRLNIRRSVGEVERVPWSQERV